MMSNREKAVRAQVRNFLYPMTEAEMQAELDLAIKEVAIVRTKYINEYIEECRTEPDGFAA